MSRIHGKESRNQMRIRLKVSFQIDLLYAPQLILTKLPTLMVFLIYLVLLRKLANKTQNIQQLFQKSMEWKIIPFYLIKKTLGLSFKFHSNLSFDKSNLKKSSFLSIGICRLAGANISLCSSRNTYLDLISVFVVQQI